MEYGGSGGFADLDLTNDKVKTTLPILKTGIYDVVCKKAEFKQNNAKTGSMVACIFESLDMSGQISFNFNIKNPSAKAQEIGRSQLKTFLTFAGHPNPDKPGNIKSLEGLKVRIVVEKDGTYTKDGKTYDNYDIKGFFKMEGPLPVRSAAPQQSNTTPTSGAREIQDDEIPF